MKHVHCSDCVNKLAHASFRPAEASCLVAYLPLSASASMTVRDALSLTRKNIHLSRICDDFQAAPVLTEEVKA